MEIRWTGAESRERERAEPFVNIERFLACFKSNGTTALMALHFEAELVAAAFCRTGKYVREGKPYGKVIDMQHLEVGFLPRDLEGKKKLHFF